MSVNDASSPSDLNTSGIAPAGAIAYVVSQYPATSHTFISREVRELRRRGIRIETFSVRRPAKAERTSGYAREAYASTTYLLPIRPVYFLKAHLGAVLNSPFRYLRTLKLALGHRAPGAKSLLWALFHFAEAILLARELKRLGIRHVHNHFANAAANVGLFAANFLQLPWSMTLHGISEFDYPAGLLLPDKVKRAKFVACVSHFGRAQAMRMTASGEWHKFVIVRCGLDLTAFPPPVKAAEEEGPFRIICVGRLSPEKGHIGLLQAFSKIADAYPQVRLKLVGDGPSRAQIEQAVLDFGLTSRVALAGRLDEDGTLLELSRSDLLVLPSFMEGLPVVLMEALALEVPVLASHVAGIPELLEDEAGAVLFRPGDWSDLGNKLERLIGDRPLRRRIAVLGRARIESEFAIDRAVLPLIGAFGSVCPAEVNRS